MNATTYLRAVETGAVTEDDAVSTAARTSRQADEMAAMVEALAADVEATDRRWRRNLQVLRDALGEVHVALDELTEALAGDPRVMLPVPHATTQTRNCATTQDGSALYRPVNDELTAEANGAEVTR